MDILAALALEKPVLSFVEKPSGLAFQLILVTSKEVKMDYFFGFWRIKKKLQF